jgi:PAS domain S-box-containing protein
MTKSEKSHPESDPHPVEGPPSIGEADAGEILALILEHSNDAIYILAGTRFPFINLRFQQLFGVTQEEVNANDFNFMDLVAPRSHHMLRERAEHIARGETVRRQYEFCALATDGREVEVEASTTRIKYHGEDATLGIVRDITERKEAEKKLKESEGRLRTVISNTPIVLWAVDQEGIFTFSQGMGLKALGLKPGQVVGQSVFDVYKDIPEIQESIQRTLDGEAFRGRVRVGDLVFETQYSPLFDEEGEVIGALGVSADVSDRVTLEAQLGQATKMEAIGRLAGGIAHDFNNILTVINGNAELGLLTLKSEDPLRDRLDSILQASAHAQDLTSRLLAFSRKQIASPRVLDLNDVLRELEPMLQRLIGEHTDLGGQYCEGVAAVRADPGQIEQVLVNLVVNAQDAMPGGGSITVQTAIRDLDKAYCRQHPYVEPGPHVLLSVSDTGVGMSDEMQAMIFEPFYTTKSAGTGLGLSTVYGIVKQSGGSIEIFSEEGVGTRVDIFMPVADQPPETVVEEPVSDMLPLGKELILLVEDEDAVRDLAAEILTDLGYTVQAFGSPTEAEEFFRGEDRNVDLLLTDVVMPGMSGAELVSRLMPLRPELKVLYMSGYTDDAIAQHGVLDEGVRLIPKPFTSSGLANKVRQALDAPAD